MLDGPDSTVGICCCSLIRDEDDERWTPEPTQTRKAAKITTKEESEMIRAQAFLHRLDGKIQEKDDAIKRLRYIAFDLLQIDEYLVLFLANRFI